MFRSQPVHLLAILATATALTVAFGSSRVSLLVLAAAVLVAALIVMVQTASQGESKGSAAGSAGSPQPFAEAESERVLRVTAYAGTILVSGISIGVAAFWPTYSFVLLLLAAAWIIVWWMPAARLHTLTNTIVINRDEATVFAFVSDQRNVPRYYTMYEQTVEKLGDGPIGAGTQFPSYLVFRAGHVPHLRKDASFVGTEEIVDFEPNHRLTIRVISGLSPNLGTYTIDELPQGTRLTYRFDMLLSFATCVLGSRLSEGPAYRFRKANREAAWQRAKEILENETP